MCTNTTTPKGVSYSRLLNIYNQTYNAIIILNHNNIYTRNVPTVDDPVILDLNVIKSSHK